MRARYKILLGTAAIVLLLDQAAKLLVLKSLTPWQSIIIIPGLFNLVRVHNSGAAFGFMNNPEGSTQLWFFGAAALIASVVILWLTRTEKSEKKTYFFGLGLVLGGALGNLVDRILHHYVVDFLDFYLKDMHWPAFNVADIAICLGVFLLTLHIWRNKPEQGTQVNNCKQGD